MTETAYDRVRRYVDYKHNKTPHIIHRSDLADITCEDLRNLVDEIERLRAESPLSDQTLQRSGEDDLTMELKEEAELNPEGDSSLPSRSLKEILRLRKELLRFCTSRLYVIGFHSGWDACEETNNEG